ncbi:hypothetical protein K2173_006216 [Erythroxylum novogranatense]|uniref:Uncharacterized protein n=1 Tax=Erythroxylum novogranatense TaxID=1862640 RepID=A0AAV8TDJ4_9ROSI|nr:hypothetical protein K2173_006216 [Erythroxylum novogranatense]
MEPSPGERKESYMSETRESSELYHGDTLQAKMVELIGTREELKQAKDSATESWLDSRPVIDELERLQSGLASAKNRTSMSNIVISELESQLEAIGREVRTKKEEELKATKLINELTQALDQEDEELQNIKGLRDEERRDRSKLKLVLKMKRQTLRTLQLTLRATRIETEAFGASAGEATRHINSAETENDVIELSQEEYYALTKRAKDEEALAEWRIDVSMEQKLAAEASRNLILSRLRGLHSNGSSIRTINEDKLTEDDREDAIVEEEENDFKEEIEAVMLKTQNRSSSVSDGRKTSRKSSINSSRSHNKKRLLKKKKKKKASIFGQIKSFLVRSISKLFK